MKFLLDTGFLYAQLNENDLAHKVVSSVSFSPLDAIYLPTPAITEVTFLLQRDIGRNAVADFIAAIPKLDLIVESPTAGDYTRTAEILRQFHDNKIDFVDACIVAMAERLNITKILTVDHRHFRSFDPKHCSAFELIPEKL